MTKTELEILETIRLWNGDIKFANNLVFAFFVSSMAQIAKSHYIRGKKHERRDRKRKCSKKHFNRKYLL